MARRTFALLVSACLLCCHKDAAQSTATLIQRVNRAPAPPIVWNAPAAIPFGTALSALQLNATSSVAGIFDYEPPLGTILPAGTDILSVQFSPLDRNYMIESASTPIVVLPPGSSSFDFHTLGAFSPRKPLILHPGIPATVQLVLTPVGDFHQPITMSCRLPPSGRICQFSASVVRPTSSPVRVKLTFAPSRSPAPGRPVAEVARPNGVDKRGCLSGITTCTLLGLLTFRRRLRNLATLSALASVLCVSSLLVLASGCGTESVRAGAEITVDASSLVETHPVQIYVVEDDWPFSPRGKRPDRSEGTEQ